MPHIEGLQSSRESIPDLRRAVPTARGNELTVGRPGQRTHGIFVSSVGGKEGPCACIPDLRRAVPTARGNELTVGRPGHCIYVIAVPIVGKEPGSRRLGTVDAGILQSKQHVRCQYTTWTEDIRKAAPNRENQTD